VFRLLAQDVAGLYTVEKLADHLSELADILLDAAIAPRLAEDAEAPRRDAEVRRHQLRQARRQGTRLRLRPRPGLPLRRPGAGSRRKLRAARHALNTWLSAQTAAGQLFETDLRLRPNGDSGLVVSSMESFRKYQLESAWVWEHQALTRARFSAGDPAVGEAFEKIRCEVLCQQRDLAKLRADIVEMRQKMMDSHATRGDLRETVFDLKHDPGGLVDVEFIVQYLVLGHSHAHPELTGNKGNIALLKMAADAGLIPASWPRRCATPTATTAACSTACASTAPRRASRRKKSATASRRCASCGGGCSAIDW
jgi:glutamate-ammonia-ligase adenylyltransferase